MFRFRFRSAASFEPVSIDAKPPTVWHAKRAIVDKKSLFRESRSDFDLVVTYDGEDAPLDNAHKLRSGARLVVKRVPSSIGIMKRIRWEEEEAKQQVLLPPSSSRLDRIISEAEALARNPPKLPSMPEPIMPARAWVPEDIRRAPLRGSIPVGERKMHRACAPHKLPPLDPTSDRKKGNNKHAETSDEVGVWFENAPVELRCPITGEMLVDAVELACCGSIVRECSVRSAERCPLCAVKLDGATRVDVSMREEVARHARDTLSSDALSRAINV